MAPIDKFTKHPYLSSKEHELSKEEYELMSKKVEEEDKLLEYVEQVGNRFCPDLEWDDATNDYILAGTTALLFFRYRYNGNGLNANFKYEDYIKNEDIQGTLQALNIDIDKFWYLLLFISDYIYGCCFEGEKLSDTPRNMIKNLGKSINDNALAKDDSTDKLSLTLSIGKRSLFVINNKTALAYLSDLCSLEPEEIKRHTQLDNSSIAENQKAESNTVMLLLFTRMLRYFLIEVLPNPETKPSAYTTVSLNKMLLISRLVYFTKLSTNSKFTGYDIENDKPCLNYLKDYIKGYKDYEIKRLNSIYGGSAS